MPFIEKADCKQSVGKWQIQHLQNKKHISTFVTFFCWLVALQLIALNFAVG